MRQIGLLAVTPVLSTTFFEGRCSVLLKQDLIDSIIYVIIIIETIIYWSINFTLPKIFVGCVFEAQTCY